MAPRFVAVLDVGKTNVKVVLHDLSTGADLFVRTRPNAVVAVPPYPHFDVEGIWDFALEALAALAAEHAVDALTVTTHGASAVLLGDDGLAMPVLDYEHAAIDDVRAAYDAVRPPFAETYSPALPGGLNVGAQLFWQQRTVPDRFAAVRAITTYPQYWTFRLTGVLASEATSFGAHTDLWNPGIAGWSSLVGRMGWTALMAPVRSAFDILGPIAPEVAARTGLPPGTPVACGIHDSNASLLPHLLRREPPFAVVSTGTWVIVFAVGGSLAALDPARDGLANVDAFARPVPSARWMGGREFDMLVGQRPETPDAAALARVIRDGVMVLPTFVKGCGPYPQGEGRWTADPASLSPAERTAAASLYAALVTARSLEVAGAAGPVIVEGPFARNRLFAEALARLTGRPVIPSSGATGTSAGAALLALGPEATLPEASDEPVGESYGLEGFENYAARWRELAG